MMSSDYAVGDLVEAVKGERRVIDRIHDGGGPVFLGLYLGKPFLLGSSLVQTYIESGYTLSVIEKAAPKLPTEPGTVITWWHDGTSSSLPLFARLYAEGGWYFDKCSGIRWFTPERLEREIAGNTFTVLEPVPVTAKKVLDALGEYLDVQVVGRTKGEIIAALAEEFGVTDDPR